MKLMVNDNCCVCSNCSKACPVAAPYYDGDKIAIDHEKCIQCGQCVESCLLGAIYDADAPEKAAEEHAPTVLSADLCVIGCGASGMIAAARAAEAGKSVILLEKGKGVSGSTPYATGLRMMDSRWEREADIPSRTQKMIDSAVRGTRGELNEQLITNVMHALPGFFDWCCEWDNPAEYFELKTNPFGELTVDCKDSEHGAGVYVAKKLPGKLRELGVKVLSYTRAKELILENGVMTGVLAEDSGGDVIVRAKDFLIATGSLINCPELLDKVEKGYAEAFTRRYGHRIYTLTGDGVLMAQRAGVPINYDKIAIAFIGHLCMPVDMQGIHFGRPIDTEMLCQIDKKEAVRINLNGKRWVNEDFSGNIAPAMVKQPMAASYTVMDHDVLMTVPEDPMKNMKPGMPMMPGMGMTPGAVYGKPIDLDKLHEFAQLKGKHLLIADTLEELAEKMGVPADEFVKTIAEYNAFCESGKDGQFGKAAEYLHPVARAPFYAFSTFLATDGAFGGIEVDPDMHVIGSDGPIDNLYAAGDVCSSYYVLGDGRKNTIINDFSWAVASGFIAGNSIAAK